MVEQVSQGHHALSVIRVDRKRAAGGERARRGVRVRAEEGAPRGREARRVRGAQRRDVRRPVRAQALAVGRNALRQVRALQRAQRRGRPRHRQRLARWQRRQVRRPPARAVRAACARCERRVTRSRQPPRSAVCARSSVPGGVAQAALIHQRQRQPHAALRAKLGSAAQRESGQDARRMSELTRQRNKRTRKQSDAAPLARAARPRFLWCAR
jgi:hypothetical protein